MKLSVCCNADYLEDYDSYGVYYICKKCRNRFQPKWGKMKHKDFTAFLYDLHNKQYGGLDDTMPDDFEAWLSELSVDEFILYADEYKKEGV